MKGLNLGVHFIAIGRCSVIVWMKVVLKRTVVNSNCRFGNLSQHVTGAHTNFVTVVMFFLEEIYGNIEKVHIILIQCDGFLYDMVLSFLKPKTATYSDLKGFYIRRYLSV